MPAPQDRPGPYDAYAVEYATRLDPTLVRAAERLSELAGARDGMRLLDLATGTGAVARAAAKRGASVVGVDVSPGMLAVATDLSPQLDFRYSDARALPFDDGQFDAVTCALSLSHFKDRDAVLSEIRRVLRPGGRLVASAWADGTRVPTAVIADLLDRYGAPAPSDRLDEETWEDRGRGTSILRRVGFADVTVSSESYDGEFVDAEAALAWSLSWPLIASRLASLDAPSRNRFRRECHQTLAGSPLTWTLAFNLYIATGSTRA
jgi:SAM-dependent methyltransferase